MAANDGAAKEKADDDDVSARFAPIEEATRPSAEDNTLPPVPPVSFERPAAPGMPKSANTGRSSSIGGSLIRARTGGETGLRSAGLAFTVGTGLVGSIVGGTLLGWLADKYLLHSTGTPWGLIAGFLLGVASGFVNLIRVSNQLNRDER